MYLPTYRRQASSAACSTRFVCCSNKREYASMTPDFNPDAIAYLNGRYVRLGDAQISVLDRGFIFGDGIYDVVPAYRGRAFRMAEHLNRLERSLRTINITVDMDRTDWEDLVANMLERSGLDDCMVYIQVTRGPARRDHAFPDDVSPTIFCMVSPFERPTTS